MRTKRKKRKSKSLFKNSNSIAFLLTNEIRQVEVEGKRDTSTTSYER
jgi:hypothetical protein